MFNISPDTSTFEFGGALSNYPRLVGAMAILFAMFVFAIIAYFVVRAFYRFWLNKFGKMESSLKAFIFLVGVVLATTFATAIDRRLGKVVLFIAIVIAAISAIRYSIPWYSSRSSKQKLLLKATLATVAMLLIFVAFPRLGVTATIVLSACVLVWIAANYIYFIINPFLRPNETTTAVSTPSKRPLLLRYDIFSKMVNNFNSKMPLLSWVITCIVLIYLYAKFGVSAFVILVVLFIIWVMTRNSK